MNLCERIRTVHARSLLHVVAFSLLLMPALAEAMGSWTAWPGSRGRSSVLKEVSGFGDNPGMLRMFSHVPQSLGPGRPLVVALHGCTQQADAYDDETGWIGMANRFGFALLLPQAQANPLRCFRWFDAAHNRRDRGEAASILQMIDRMADEHRIDRRQVYVTGLSAGGAMTAVMLSVYPEVFAGGAIVAGVPYLCAANDMEAQTACGLFNRPLAANKQLTPRQWGDLVRSASAHEGVFPRVSLWHGSGDASVNPQNLIELMKQWTAVNAIDQTPDAEETVGGHLRRSYRDGSGATRVETWLVNGIGHGVPVDPGSGADQCGIAAPFILPAGICSSLHILRFWGLAPG